jgi:trehalose 6-phosphate synthase
MEDSPPAAEPRLRQRKNAPTSARGRSTDHWEMFAAYVSRALQEWSPIIASNRAPYELNPAGGVKRGSGGLVSAMLSVAEATGATWVACARTEAERRLAERAEPLVLTSTGQRTFPIHHVSTNPISYEQYYSVIANPLLWFIQHYLWPLAYEPVVNQRIHDAWDDGYVAVNQQIAAAVIDVARISPRPPLVLTQDYQLYLAPRAIRDALPHATLQQFVHIPWPSPQYWTVLPRTMRDAIIDGLLANDVVGFQTNRDVRNFLGSCEELMGLRVDHRDGAVLHRGRVIWVRAYPVSVDVGGLLALSAGPGVAREDARLAGWKPEKLIVRVDRTDPSKNIIRGFLAYQRMLTTHPELIGKVQFWAFLQPSRQDVAAYKEYLQRVRSTAAKINSELQQPGWQPIRLELGENLKRAVAAYKAFDVLLVNPIYDGMNLVAKEGVLLNTKDGVLVLSENAGAHEQLGKYALSVNPFDVDATADAIFRGLMMPVEERRSRGEEIRRQVQSDDILHWLRTQLEDIRTYAPSRSGGTALS